MGQTQVQVQKIGVFGGSFDPPHIGHVTLAKEAIKQLKLTKLLVVPAGTPPHKDKPATPFTDRLEMCRLAFSGIEKTEISDIEAGGVSYTIDTLRKIRHVLPGATKLYLIIGSDMLFIFDKWYKYSSILKESIVVAAAREDDCYSDMLEQANRIGHIKIINYPAKVTSSTEIRAALASGCDVDGALDNISPLVKQYIGDRGLYAR